MSASDSVPVTVQGLGEIPLAAGKPLLHALRDAGIFISSACGGRGACGMCRLTAPGGAPDPFTKTELHWLTEADRAAGLRLACQIHASAELTLQLPARSQGIRPYQAQILSTRDLTYDIKEVRLKLIDPSRMPFRAGQYAMFKIPPYGPSPEPVFRPYSMAANPAENDVLEFEIRFVPNGIATTYIHQHMKAGDRLTIIGPDGDFGLKESERDMIMIAGGSGMAPIKSVLLDMLHRGIHRKTTYFFGAKARRDLFLLDEMEALENKLTGFRFVPALSEPLPGDAWKGETGLITEVVARSIADGADIEAYLCGSPPMINACLKMLRTKKIPEDRIHYDRFL